MVKEIKILGTGCPNCIRLEDNVKMALEKSGINTKITKVTDIAKIMEYGIMSTPGLVFDDEVVSFGRVIEPDDIIKLLEEKNDN